MRPTLHNDTYVLVERTTHAGPGDIVLCRHPYRRDVHILKRVATTSDVGMHLLGDNPPASTDSSSFGEVPWTHLVGIVTAQMK